MGGFHAKVTAGGGHVSSSRQPLQKSATLNSILFSYCYEYCVYYHTTVLQTVWLCHFTRKWKAEAALHNSWELFELLQSDCSLAVCCSDIPTNRTIGFDVHVWYTGPGQRGC